MSSCFSGDHKSGDLHTDITTCNIAEGSVDHNAGDHIHMNIPTCNILLLQWLETFNLHEIFLTACRYVRTKGS